MMGVDELLKHHFIMIISSQARVISLNTGTVRSKRAVYISTVSSNSAAYVSTVPANSALYVSTVPAKKHNAVIKHTAAHFCITIQGDWTVLAAPDLERAPKWLTKEN